MKRIVILIIMCMALQLSLSAQTSFRTAELGRLAKLLALETTALPEGYSHPQANGTRLTVHVARQTVDHIGLQLFSDEMRAAGKSPVFDFLERYFLQLKYPPQSKTMTNMIRDDEFWFLTGSLQTVDQLLLTDAFSYNCDNHRYQATWSRSGQTLLSVSFPVEYELISGENKIEADENLPADVRNTLIPPQTGSLLETRNDYYIVRNITNRLYIVNNKLVQGVNYPVESASNMLMSTAYEGDYAIRFTQITYGFRKTVFEVPLRQWIAYCQQQGCELYFGLEGTESNGDVNCVVFAVNKTENYNHVLTLTVPSVVVENKCGTLDARLYPYVPTHNVLNLFSTYRKSNPKTFVSK